ncbi:hypothetical protein AHiyo1_24290 [Arthrobacter sp. Hiyo1]|nr:hypothetical protein AHiyo1_24290 [Arthrobacter sp. Hiyo1]
MPSLTRCLLRWSGRAAGPVLPSLGCWRTSPSVGCLGRGVPQGQFCRPLDTSRRRITVAERRPCSSGRRCGTTQNRPSATRAIGSPLASGTSSIRRLGVRSVSRQFATSGELIARGAGPGSCVGAHRRPESSEGRPATGRRRREVSKRRRNDGSALSQPQRTRPHADGSRDQHRPRLT